MLGGLTRDFITELSKQTFDPKFGLFSLSSNGVALQPNPFSFIIPNHLIYFKFIGNMIGKVKNFAKLNIFYKIIKIMMEEKAPFGVNFTRSFLKLLLSFNFRNIIFYNI